MMFLILNGRAGSSPFTSAMYPSSQLVHPDKLMTLLISHSHCGASHVVQWFQDCDDNAMRHRSIDGVIEGTTKRCPETAPPWVSFLGKHVWVS